MMNAKIGQQRLWPYHEYMGKMIGMLPTSLPICELQLVLVNSPLLRKEGFP